jgi:diguanylate cyclase (GGDEF)-like protein
MSAGLIVMLWLVFTLDMATASAPVQHFYYVPIILASLWFGVIGGLATSLAAIVLYHAANARLLILQYQHWDIVQIVLFVSIGLVTAKLVADRRRLNILATTDDLTGLHNLRSFEARIVTLVRAARAAGAPLAVLVLDVDRLKSLNDRHGHLAGAEAVRLIGHVIGAATPPSGVACRYGGDEFVIAVPGFAHADARALGDDFRRAVQSLAPVLAGIAFPAGTLSISIGAACQAPATPADVRGDAELAEGLFRAADRALYHAKERGRNAVHVA